MMRKRADAFIITQAHDLNSYAKYQIKKSADTTSYMQTTADIEKYMITGMRCFNTLTKIGDNLK